MPLRTRAPIFAALFALLLIASAPAAATEPLHIATRMSVAEDSGIDAQMLADCPLQEEFSTYLHRNLGSRKSVLTDAPLPLAKGRSLVVELTDYALSGNAFVGYRLYMRLRGTLYADGRKLASFSDRAQFLGEWSSPCYEVRVSLRAEAWYVGRWVRNPVDGQELKHMGE